MSHIDTIAHKIVADAHQSSRQQVFLDPLTLMMAIQIISSIITAIKLYCAWKNAREAATNIAEVSKTPGVISRAFVIRHIKSKLGRKYREYGKELENSLFNVAAKMSIAEIEQLFEDVNTTQEL